MVRRFFRKALLLFFLLFLILYVISFSSPRAAYYIDKLCCMPLRYTLSSFSSIFPFSVFEAFVIFSVPLFIIFIKRKGKIITMRFCLVGFAILFFLYAVTLSIPSNVGRRYESEVETVGAQDLFLIEKRLSERINDICFQNFSNKNFHSEYKTAKKTLFPRLYTLAGISGLYYFPTAEQVVNSDLPDYLIPISSAHEYMHFLGVMREDEANLFAYVCLTASESAYDKYSAYLYAYEVIGRMLYGMSPEDYIKTSSFLCEYARCDLNIHKEYSKKRESGFFRRASLYLSDKVITSRDKRGIDSYSSSAVLIADYILENGV